MQGRRNNGAVSRPRFSPMKSPESVKVRTEGRYKLRITLVSPLTTLPKLGRTLQNLRKLSKANQGERNRKKLWVPPPPVFFQPRPNSTRIPISFILQDLICIVKILYFFSFVFFSLFSIFSVGRAFKILRGQLTTGWEC